MTDKKKLQIYIDEDIYNIIKDNAEREKRSVSNYAGIIMEQAVKELQMTQMTQNHRNVLNVPKGEN